MRYNKEKSDIMKRNIDLKDISDGKLYEASDMAKVDCNGCKECHACCHGMGSSILLDPYDIFMLKKNLRMSLEELMQLHIELHVVDGVILPNIKMNDNTETCNFLDLNGRCSIHSFRPGICRLFPLGRYYENRNFKYFVQVHECPYPNKIKVKVSKWIGIQSLKKYEAFINSWHYFLKDVESVLAKENDEILLKQATMYLLHVFFVMDFMQEETFFDEYSVRLEEAKKTLKIKEI